MYTCTHVRMYACAHVRMYTCTHVHMYTCTHVHMHTCTHAHIYMYVYVYVYMRTRACCFDETYHKLTSLFFSFDKLYTSIFHPNATMEMRQTTYMF